MSHAELSAFRASDSSRLRALRAGLGLAVVFALLAFALRVHADGMSAPGAGLSASVVQTATR